MAQYWPNGFYATQTQYLCKLIRFHICVLCRQNFKAAQNWLFSTFPPPSPPQRSLNHTFGVISVYLWLMQPAAEENACLAFDRPCLASQRQTIQSLTICLNSTLADLLPVSCTDMWGSFVVSLSCNHDHHESDQDQDFFVWSQILQREAQLLSIILQNW